jgi:23S rRNA (adenine(2503)-C(2))-methyltransferase
MNRSKLQQLLEGEPKFREKQILENVYKKHMKTWNEMTNIPAQLREKLSELPILTIKPNNRVVSLDGTIKTLFECEDGALVEAVMIPNKEFKTVCVSSQVGCAMACSFCATGTLGLTRNLTADEIADQVLYYAQDHKITNVVYMGMGEPLMNLDNVFASVDVLNDLLEIGARRISVSTCGVIPGIKRIAEYPKQINLAISIHSPDDELRSQIMPVNKGFPLVKLMEACTDYVKKTKRKLMFEYVMLQNINDSDGHAERIGELLSKLKPLVVLNLIPFHQTFLQFTPASGNRIHRFQKIVQDAGVDCLIRHSAGVDVDAACGQLARTAYDRQ